MSKKIIFVILTILANLNCYSQAYHKFRFGLGFGRTESTRSTILQLEPSWRLNDKVTLGWRIEGMGEKGIRECYSLTLNGQYYLTKKATLAKDFRFFIGLGAGAFFGLHDSPPVTVLLPNGQPVEGYVDGETSAGRGGLYPRIGLEYRRFSFTADLNLVYRKFLKFTYFDPILNQTQPVIHLYRSDNYVGFKITYFFGGGKKKNM